jgi:menaquinone-dependent protoporphyrinogen IX oxidase
MPKKVLVTYSTRTGSTKGVAETIGTTLSGLGEVVDVAPMQEVTDISQYSAVIAGSSIQPGKWLPEAMSSVFLQPGFKTFMCYVVSVFVITHSLLKNGFVAEALQKWVIFKPIKVNN